MNKAKVIPFVVVGFLYLIGIASPLASAQQTMRRFTVADDIELATFGDLYTGQAEAVQFSPDGNYFAVDTERGRLDLNRPEDSLQFYRSEDAENFLRHSNDLQPPSPVWVVNRSAAKEGPIIQNWRWLRDSSGVAFLEPTENGDKRLVLADLRKKAVEALTLEKESVTAFDIWDRQHYVYKALDPVEWEKRQAELKGPAAVGTGHEMIDLLFPDDPVVRLWFYSRKFKLWVNAGGKRFEVKYDAALAFGDDFALSPDGLSLVTTLPVSEVPSAWEMLYPPPYASSHTRIHAGHNSTRQYVLVNVQTGLAQPLTDAPIGTDAGWYAAVGSPSWSSDGQAILLLGTFLNSKDHMSSRPCVAVVDLPSNTRTCVEMLKGLTETGFEEGYHWIKAASFVNGKKHRVAVTFSVRENQSIQTTEYQQSSDGTWQVAERMKGDVEEKHNGFEVTAKQWFNEPPRLVAKDKQISRVIWDPNPQLKSIELGDASIYTWRDKEGREWKGGLYKPTDYKAGQRYPLVIQTHGFNESVFSPPGSFPTAFAARELAVSGIIVLQIGKNVVGRCPDDTPDEGPCNVSLYESAANQLISQGLVDPERIGVIGFSRTCFHVMEMLTMSSFHLKAALVTDGMMAGYPEYLFFDDVRHEFDALIGAPPFGANLQQWLKRSPGFNLDKITAPLLVVGTGSRSLLWMWEPYAGLRYLHKPVELMILNTHEHVLTNPAVRMASQGGTVEWFRFWLQDYEDPDPAKAEQYARWRDLRRLQEANEHNSTLPQPASN